MPSLPKLMSYDLYRGLDSRRKAVDEGVLLYLKVADIPAKLKEIEAAGGHTIRGKRPVIDGTEEYGFAALFLDPSGNQLGLWAGLGPDHSALGASAAFRPEADPPRRRF